MQREIQLTADGSHTVFIPGINVTYHSIHGALQESLHVFIQAGLNFVLDKSKSADPVSILEMGLGTGLNALLTLKKTSKQEKIVFYQGIELYPLNKGEVAAINYGSLLKMEDLFLVLHTCSWEEDVIIQPRFTLHKTELSLLNFVGDSRKFDLIYYDAFAPAVQPELWTKTIFEKLYSLLKEEGVLVTYCSKGDVRRNMIAAGFVVEKLQGPLQKREMLRAIKRVAI